jgi:hypothetical protein
VKDTILSERNVGVIRVTMANVPQIQHIVCKAEEEHAGDGEEGCNKLYKLLNRLLALPRLSGVNNH